MIVVDSSVAIAGFASWHERHAVAVKILAQRPRIAAHAVLETYSVLTRLPPPHRALPELVEDYLRHRFAPDAVLTFPQEQYRGLVSSLADSRILGGQVYDALIAATAAGHDATLVSLDRRASLVYDRMGTRVNLLDDD